MFSLISATDREFSRVYSDYYAYILKAVSLKTETPEDAEDICHEVFVDLYRKFHEVTNLRSWLLKAAHFAVMNHYRRRYPGEILSIDERFDMTDPKENPAERTVRNEIQALLSEPENFPSEQDRRIFTLIAENRLSYTDTAREVGVTKRIVDYSFNQTCRRIIGTLKKNGISRMDEAF